MVTGLSNLMSPSPASKISVRDGLYREFHQSVNVELSLSATFCAVRCSKIRTYEGKADVEDEVMVTMS
jgi:hypothetical protein